MMRPRALAGALSAAVGIDEYIVSHRRLEGVRRTVGSGTSEEELGGSTLAAQLFADRREGRGQCHVQIRDERPLSPQIRDATARALAATGPSWHLRPPSAPARVHVSDSEWQHAPREIVDQALQDFISNLPSGVRALQVQLDFAREDLGVIASNGFDDHYRRTGLSVRAVLQAGSGQAVPLHMHARQRSDLHWQESIAAAARLSMDYRTATPLTARSCDLVFRSDAYAPRDEADFGMWTPLVQQCSAERFRSGIARYTIGQSITPDAARGQPLTMHSDGTRDFGLHSAPFGDDGQPVRRFAMVDKGIAAGHAVDHREAALGATTANAGVRGLQIAGGAHSMEELMSPGERPLLVVDRLSTLATEPRGRIAMHIDLATWRTQPAGQSVHEERCVGGVLCGDLYHWLTDAYYSREMHEMLWCRAPKVIRVNGLQVHS